MDKNLRKEAESWGKAGRNNTNSKAGKGVSAGWWPEVGRVTPREGQVPAAGSPLQPDARMFEILERDTREL